MAIPEVLFSFHRHAASADNTELPVFLVIERCKN